jgi:hypothetical protein
MPEQAVLSANARRGSTFFLFLNRFFGVIIPYQSLRGTVPKLCHTAIG